MNTFGLIGLYDPEDRSAHGADHEHCFLICCILHLRALGASGTPGNTGRTVNESGNQEVASVRIALLREHVSK